MKKSPDIFRLGFSYALYTAFKKTDDFILKSHPLKMNIYILKRDDSKESRDK